MEENLLFSERFIRTLKSKIFQHMTAASKNIYFDVLDNIVNKYNMTVHCTKIKRIDITSDSYTEYNEDSNETKILNSKLVIMLGFQNTK